MSKSSGLRVIGAAWLGAVLLAGCLGTQIYPTLQQRTISLKPGDLEAHGIGFLTPSAATGQEEEKQAIALVFAEVLQQQRRSMRVVPLAETLGAVNKSGLAEGYIRMYSDYRDSGLLGRETLHRVGKATGVRYMALIKVQGFGQSAKERWGALGLRIVETKTAGVRLFFQIWDTTDGTVAWEATQELHYSHDTTSERQLTLPQVVGRAAEDLVSKLP